MPSRLQRPWICSNVQPFVRRHSFKRVHKFLPYHQSVKMALPDRPRMAGKFTAMKDFAAICLAAVFIRMVLEPARREKLDAELQRDKRVPLDLRRHQLL